MTNWLDGAVADLPDDFHARIGLVHFGRVSVGPSSDALRDECTTAAAEILAANRGTPDEWQKGGRGLLKQSGFRPTGRSKPASEYLMRTLEETREFTFINNLVDINNLLSLQTYLPMSVLDAAAFSGPLVVRIGQPGESYVFNQAGHAIDVKQLLVVCDAGDGSSDLPTPLGNPIKDSMAGKLKDETASAVAIIYAPPAMVSEDQMDAILADWVRLVTTHAGGQDATTRQLLT